MSSKLKLVIDPGHGGHDPGAVANGLREKDLVLAISRFFRDFLLLDYEGVEVRLTRDSDRYLTFAERCKNCKRLGSRLFC